MDFVSHSAELLVNVCMCVGILVCHTLSQLAMACVAHVLPSEGCVMMAWTLLPMLAPYAP